MSVLSWETGNRQGHLEQWLTRFGKAHGYETVTVVFAR